MQAYPPPSERHREALRSRFATTFLEVYETVTKADIVDSLANEFELSKRQAGEIVDMILDEITRALKPATKCS